MSVTTSDRLGVRLDITARKGADFHRRFHTQTSSGDTYVNFDFNEYNDATLAVKRKPNSPIVELKFTTEDGSINLGSDGRFELKLDAETMDKIREGTYHYDMYLSNNNYSKRDFLYGMFIIEDKITK